MLSESSTIREGPSELVELQNAVVGVAAYLRSTADLAKQLRHAQMKEQFLIKTTRMLKAVEENLHEKIQRLKESNIELANENDALASEISRLKGMNQGLGDSDKTLEKLRQLLLKSDEI